MEISIQSMFFIELIFIQIEFWFIIIVVTTLIRL
jgi:hypothetical protein